MLEHECTQLIGRRCRSQPTQVQVPLHVGPRHRVEQFLNLRKQKLILNARYVVIADFLMQKDIVIRRKINKQITQERMAPPLEVVIELFLDVIAEFVCISSHRSFEHVQRL